LAKKILGDRAKVTTPNLASLMFFAREGNTTTEFAQTVTARRL